MKPYEILEHKADLKIRGSGSTLPELFTNLAKGMLAATCESIKNQNQVSSRNFHLDSVQDYESLLINFLNEIWFLASENKEIYSDFIFEKFGLSGIKGQAKVQKAAKIKLEIKSATFYDLKILKGESDFVSTVVFDI